MERRCTALFARACTGFGRWYRFGQAVGEKREHVLCGPCVRVAEEYGFAPVALPEWQARSLEGDGRGKDLTRAA